jgi:hypothetical protein
MGTNNVKGRTYAELKTDLTLNNVENTAISTFAGSSNITTTGALNSGSITSGFGAIDNGASNITTTGTITGGTVNATTLQKGGVSISSTAAEINTLSSVTAGTVSASKAVVVDSNKDISSFRNLTATNLTGSLQTAAQTNITSVGTLTGLTVNGNVSISDGTNDFDIASHDGTNGLKLAGTLVKSTAAELNILDGVTSSTTELNLVDGSTAGSILNNKAVIYGNAGEVNATKFQISGTDISSTATELNLMGGGSSIGTTQVVSGHGIVTNAGGTMKQTNVDQFDAYFSGTTRTLSNKTLSSPTLGGTVTLSDQANIAFNTSTGTKIGTATTQKLAFFNKTPIVQPSGASQAAVSSQSLSDTAQATYTQADMTKVQTELNDVTALLNEMRTVLVNLGLMKGS